MTGRFFDRLVAETREEQARFAMTPQLIAGLTGQISRMDYIAYLTEAFHHVRHTVPLMQEARAGSLPAAIGCSSMRSMNISRKRPATRNGSSTTLQRLAVTARRLC